MSQIRSMTTILASLAMVAVFAAVVESCTPEMKMAPSIGHKTKYSDIVVAGVPKSRMKYSDSEDLYTVDFEVRCIFKGDRLPHMIKIRGVGKKDRMCAEVKMTSGDPIMAYLNKAGDNFEPTYKGDPWNSVYEEEITVVCGVKLLYPEGYTNNTITWKCPEMLSEEEMADCLPLPTDPPAPAGGATDKSTQKTAIDGTGSTDGNNETSNNGQKPPYKPAKPVIRGNLKEVKIGASKGGKGKTSENLEATTPGGSSGYVKSSWIVSLSALFVCLCAFVVRV